MIVVFLASFLSACTSKDYFRTDITDIPCLPDISNACVSANLIQNTEEDYTLGFVEIDDQGQFYDGRQAVSLIKTLKSQQQPQYVIVYVHGWHHNAKADDFAIKRFKEILKQTKHRNPAFKVTGIYVGWRGETLSLPWLRSITFWDRKLVSEEVGRNSLLDFLLQVETAVKGEGESNNILLTVGHSLGASVIFNALHQVLLQRLVQPENNSLRMGFGNLVVLINPAFEAIRYNTIRDAAQRYSREFQFSERQKPLLVIATSESDNITKLDFSVSRLFSTAFETHRKILSEDQTATSEALSEWDLDNTAIGHFSPFITHRLQAGQALGNDYECAAENGWLNTAVNRRKELQSSKNEPSSGEGWDTGDNNQAPALLADSTKMELSHLQNSAAYDPYWVVRTDTSIFPSHGFIAQRHFWCFIDVAIKQAVVEH